MRILLYSTLVLLLVLSAGNTALGCDCLDLTPSQSFAEADFVFEGDLIRSTQSDNKINYVFRVRNVFKGPHVTEATIVSSVTNCDADFSPNVGYRVYARDFEGELNSSSCFANQVIWVTRIDHGKAALYKFVWQHWYTKALALAGIALLTTLVIRFLLRRPS